jgi:archaellum component FlaC
MDLISLLKRQAEMYKAKLEEKIGAAKTKTDIYKAHSSTLNEFYSHAFRPTVDSGEMREFDIEKTEEIMNDIKTDVDIAYGELEGISSVLQNAYNTNKDYKTSVKNKIQYLSSIVSDLNIMTRETTQSSITFKDSLANYDFIDKDFSVGTNADIATAEGIAYLHISSDTLANSDGTEIKINGNGTEGNYHVVKRVNIETANADYNVYIKYESDDDAHDQPAVIIDTQPQTWFEYEKVGFKEATQRYDTDWAVASEIHDDLTLRVNIKLKASQEINWIDIESYIPEKSRSSIKVYSIYVSEDGSEFIPIFKDRAIINSEVNLVPQRYLNDQVFNSDTVAKFASSGVFNFPKVSAQYIEIVFKQDKPYDEYIGNTYYKEINILSTGETFEHTIPAQAVPSTIINSPIGKYQLETNKMIVKGIEVFDGWRYCIGLKGIDIFNRKFARQSELITKKFSTTKPISKILLYANEIIPDEYMSYGLEKRNDWIKYYISIDDTTWYQISPMHHNQVGSLAIPPKIYEVNSLTATDVKLSAVNKGYLTSSSDVYNVRLKIVLSRPEELSESTPILEEYGLECVFGGTQQ